jgi:hypothetical protein
MKARSQSQPCSSGKTPHRTKKSATIAARIVGDRGAYGAHAYRCDRCSSWHVGSSVPTSTAPVMVRRPRIAVADDAKGTMYCPEPGDGCGHRTDLHVGGVCLRRRGSCGCRRTFPS